jgi:hypothetical protein
MRGSEVISAGLSERFGPRVAVVSLLAGLIVVLVLPSVAFGVGSPYRSGPQDVPLSLDRVFATGNTKLDIDGLDDKRVDVDIAVIDSGIDLDHPDLNVVEGVDCTAATWPLDPSDPAFECADGVGDGDDDELGRWHGTATAVDVAGLDNTVGRVGIASGARLWSVDVHVGQEEVLPAPSFDLEAVIAGVKWVTAHAAEIEVAHMAVICAPSQMPPPGPLPYCQPGSDGENLVDELEDAVEESIAAGVVYVFSAGAIAHVDSFVPQRIPDMLLTSQLSDSDGKPDGLGPTNCGSSPSPDDQKVSNSAWGAGVDVTSPGCEGSAASPHLTAAAAVLASRDNPNDVDDVREIADKLFGDSDCATTPPDTGPDVGAANCGWTESDPSASPPVVSPDGIKEPLLDVRDPVVFNPLTVAGTVALPGWDFDLKKRCAKSAAPALANYYEDTTQCSGSGRWTTFVRAENATPQSGCPGPANQAFAFNAAGSPAIIDWYSYWGSPLGPNWTTLLKIDNVYNSPACMGASSLTHIGILDHVSLGGGPLPNPRSLITAHQMSYSDWRPSGGATRLVAGVQLRWAGKERWVEVNLNSAGFPDSHPHPEVVLVDNPAPNVERVVYDGPAIGRAVPADNTSTTHWIDWKYLVTQASQQGWFTAPLTTTAETLGTHIGVQVKGPAMATLWTTNYRTQGKH